MARRNYRKKRKFRRKRKYRKKRKNTILINPRSVVTIPMRSIQNILVNSSYQKDIVSFTADDLPSVFTAWTMVFDFYRIAYIKQTYYPNVTGSPAPMANLSDDVATTADFDTVPVLNAPLFCCKTMRDTQQDQPVDIDTCLEQSSYKVYDLRRKSITLKWKPNVLGEVIDDNVLTTSQTPIFNKWFSKAEGNVPYYGLHRVISVPGALNAYNVNIRVITTFYVEMKSGI